MARMLSSVKLTLSGQSLEEWGLRLAGAAPRSKMQCCTAAQFSMGSRCRISSCLRGDLFKTVAPYLKCSGARASGMRGWSWSGPRGKSLAKMSAAALSFFQVCRSHRLHEHQTSQLYSAPQWHDHNSSSCPLQAHLVCRWMSART